MKHQVSSLLWYDGGLCNSGLLGPVISNISFNLLIKVLVTNHRHYTELKTEYQGYQFASSLVVICNGGNVISLMKINGNLISPINLMATTGKLTKLDLQSSLFHSNQNHSN